MYWSLCGINTTLFLLLTSFFLFQTHILHTQTYTQNHRHTHTNKTLNRWVFGALQFSECWQEKILQSACDFPYGFILLWRNGKGDIQGKMAYVDGKNVEKLQKSTVPLNSP